MSGGETPVPSRPDPEADRLHKAREIFFAVRELPLGEREEAVDAACAGDHELREVVLLVLRGEHVPMPIEGLADELRAAAELLAPTGAGLNVASAPPGRGGDRIGHYRLLERIGEGGFGVVFAAEQTEPVKRLVALKILKLGMDTRQIVARFEAERQALALMDHPNIARVFEAGATPTGRPYFVMELVRGEPITAFCDREKLPIPERLELFASVCDAIQHAHSKGVIHRDIKPGNVLVSYHGTKAVAKVIDFGIAKAIDHRLTEKTLFTEHRQLIGTPEYMSPEQADGLRDIDTRTDVYALGVLLYELLTGLTPFDSKRLRSAAYGEIQRIIREVDPPRPSTRLSSSVETLTSAAARRRTPPTRLATLIRRELDWVVMKSIEKDRSRRYDSASGLAADVRRYLSGDAVEAVPPSAAYRLRKFARRNKGAVIAGSLLTIALIVGLAGTSLGFLNAERQRKVAVIEKDRAEQEKERADQNALQARTAETSATRGAYSADMLSACTAMAGNQTLSARAFLETTPKALRGWEWHVLWSRLDTSTRTVAAPMSTWTPDEGPWSRLLPLPDGNSFLTVRPTDAATAQHWDLATGTLLRTYSFLNPYMFLLGADSSRLLVESRGPADEEPVCEVVVWDLRTGDVIARRSLPGPPLETGEVRGVCGLSPDGARVARVSSRVLRLQDSTTGEVLASGTARGPVFSGYFSHDGTAFLLTQQDGRVDIRDGFSLAPVAELNGHSNLIEDAEFSHDDRHLATASWDGTARVWALPTISDMTSAGSEVHAVQAAVVIPHPTGVNAVRFSPDASLVATLGADRAIRVFDARSGEFKSLYTSGALIDGALMFMPDGRTVAGRERDGTVRFWDITAEDTVGLKGHKGMTNAARLAGAGLIVSVGWDGYKGAAGCVRFWDALTGDAVASIGDPGEVAYALSVSPDGFRVAADITMTTSVWSPQDRMRRRRIEIIDLRDASARRLSFVPDQQERIQGQGVAFDPTGELLAMGRFRRISVLDAHTAAVLRTRTEGLESMTPRALAWSADARLLACAMWDNGSLSSSDILIVDPHTLQTLAAITARGWKSMVFTPDSARLCVGFADGTVRLLDARTGGLEHSFSAHEILVSSVAFNADGTRLATSGGDDGSIRLWNTATSPPFDCVARFDLGQHVADAVWGRDAGAGECLIGACDRTIGIWDTTPLRERVLARESRKTALAKVEPVVAAIFAELRDPAKVVERINADTSLDPLARRTALQIALREGLERRTSVETLGPNPNGSPPMR